MGAAISLLVVLTVSFFVVRVASVALRLTGLEEATARFQALSAFSGTGFTTNESEVIVNYPVRRKIITLLIMMGNLGLVTVLATVLVSLVRTEGEMGAVFTQVIWLIGVLGLLWFMMLNKRADRVMCDAIGRFLASNTQLGQREFHRLLQLGDDYSICEHPLLSIPMTDGGEPDLAALEKMDLQILAVRRDDGEFLTGAPASKELRAGDELIIYGRDHAHDELETAV